MKIYLIVKDNDEYGHTVLMDYDAYASREAAIATLKAGRWVGYGRGLYVEELEVVPEEDDVSNNT